MFVGCVLLRDVLKVEKWWWRQGVPVSRRGGASGNRGDASRVVAVESQYGRLRAGWCISRCVVLIYPYKRHMTSRFSSVETRVCTHVGRVRSAGPAVRCLHHFDIGSPRWRTTRTLHLRRLCQFITNYI